MRAELEELLNVVYSFCDRCDEMPINLVGKEIEKSTREILKLDVSAFVMYLSASDGHINNAEAKFLSEILGFPINNDQITQLIRDTNIYSTEFEKRTPLSLQRMVQADNLLKSHGVEMTRFSSELLVEVFVAIGSEIINSDNDVAMSERTDANIYIGMMKNFVEKNLHTGMQKAALTKNTLKSQYQILKKSNQ